jgi:hypothetical protein
MKILMQSLGSSSISFFHERFKQPLRKRFENSQRPWVRNVPQQKPLPLLLQGSTEEICEHVGEVELLLVILSLLSPIMRIEKK